ncbi:hypothetical protein CEXT_402541 [Caerostris extrusa]|uniref:Uncharacterized protein n=1 Tax=Caerostris extrusa TaxID=172846 RepID=A0AAV4WYH5_CAEEX|nr:hypothetical protein CEXT_402541 [Caerostris extrusa]
MEPVWQMRCTRLANSPSDPFQVRCSDCYHSYTLVLAGMHFGLVTGGRLDSFYDDYFSNLEILSRLPTLRVILFSPAKNIVPTFPKSLPDALNKLPLSAVG